MEAALLALALEELALHPFPGASFERLCLDLQDEHQLELDVFMRALLWRSLYRSPEVFFTDAASCGLHQVPPSRVSSTPSGADQERVEDRRLDWRDPAIPPELPVAPSVPCRLAELSNQAATTAHEAEAHASKGSRLLGSSCTTVEAAGDPSLEQQRRWLLVASGGIALRLLTAMDMSNDRNEFEHRVSEVHFQVLRNVARHKEHGQWQYRIAQELQLDPKTVFHHLKPLYRDDLIYHMQLSIPPAHKATESEVQRCGRRGLSTLGNTQLQRIGQDESLVVGRGTPQKTNLTMSALLWSTSFFSPLRLPIHIRGLMTLIHLLPLQQCATQLLRSAPNNILLEDEAPYLRFSDKQMRRLFYRVREALERSGHVRRVRAFCKQTVRYERCLLYTPSNGATTSLGTPIGLLQNEVKSEGGASILAQVKVEEGISLAAAAAAADLRDPLASSHSPRGPQGAPEGTEDADDTPSVVVELEGTSLGCLSAFLLKAAGSQGLTTVALSRLLGLDIKRSGKILAEFLRKNLVTRVAERRGKCFLYRYISRELPHLEALLAEASDPCAASTTPAAPAAPAGRASSALAACTPNPRIVAEAATAPTAALSEASVGPQAVESMQPLRHLLADSGAIQEACVAPSPSPASEAVSGVDRCIRSPPAPDAAASLVSARAQGGGDDGAAPCHTSCKAAEEGSRGRGGASRKRPQGASAARGVGAKRTRREMADASGVADTATCAAAGAGPKEAAACEATPQAASAAPPPAVASARDAWISSSSSGPRAVETASEEGGAHGVAEHGGSGRLSPPCIESLKAKAVKKGLPKRTLRLLETAQFAARLALFQQTVQEAGCCTIPSIGKAIADAEQTPNGPDRKTVQRMAEVAIQLEPRIRKGRLSSSKAHADRLEDGIAEPRTPSGDITFYYWANTHDEASAEQRVAALITQRRAQGCREAIRRNQLLLEGKLKEAGDDLRLGGGDQRLRAPAPAAQRRGGASGGPSEAVGAPGEESEGALLQGVAGEEASREALVDAQLKALENEITRLTDLEQRNACCRPTQPGPPATAASLLVVEKTLQKASSDDKVSFSQKHLAYYGFIFPVMIRAKCLHQYLLSLTLQLSCAADTTRQSSQAEIPALTVSTMIRRMPLESFLRLIGCGYALPLLDEHLAKESASRHPMHKLPGNLFKLLVFSSRQLQSYRQLHPKARLPLLGLGKKNAGTAIRRLLSLLGRMGIVSQVQGPLSSTHEGSLQKGSLSPHSWLLNKVLKLPAFSATPVTEFGEPPESKEFKGLCHEGVEAYWQQLQQQVSQYVLAERQLSWILSNDMQPSQFFSPHSEQIDNTPLSDREAADTPKTPEGSSQPIRKRQPMQLPEGFAVPEAFNPKNWKGQVAFTGAARAAIDAFAAETLERLKDAGGAELEAFVLNASSPQIVELAARVGYPTDAILRYLIRVFEIKGGSGNNQALLIGGSLRDGVQQHNGTQKAEEEHPSRPLCVASRHGGPAASQQGAADEDRQTRLTVAAGLSGSALPQDDSRVGPLGVSDAPARKRGPGLLVHRTKDVRFQCHICGHFYSWMKSISLHYERAHRQALPADETLYILPWERKRRLEDQRQKAELNKFKRRRRAAAPASKEELLTVEGDAIAVAEEASKARERFAARLPARGTVKSVEGQASANLEEEAILFSMSREDEISLIGAAVVAERLWQAAHNAQHHQRGSPAAEGGPLPGRASEGPLTHAWLFPGTSQSLPPADHHIWKILGALCKPPLSPESSRLYVGFVLSRRALNARIFSSFRRLDPSTLRHFILESRVPSAFEMRLHCEPREERQGALAPLRKSLVCRPLSSPRILMARNMLKASLFGFEGGLPSLPSVQLAALRELRPLELAALWRAWQRRGWVTAFKPPTVAFPREKREQVDPPGDSVGASARLPQQPYKRPEVATALEAKCRRPFVLSSGSRLSLFGRLRDYRSLAALLHSFGELTSLSEGCLASPSVLGSSDFPRKDDACGFSQRATGQNACSGAFDQKSEDSLATSAAPQDVEHAAPDPTNALLLAHLTGEVVLQFPKEEVASAEKDDVQLLQLLESERPAPSSPLSPFMPESSLSPVSTPTAGPPRPLRDQDGRVAVVGKVRMALDVDVSGCATLAALEGLARGRLWLSPFWGEEGRLPDSQEAQEAAADVELLNLLDGDDTLDAQDGDGVELWNEMPEWLSSLSLGRGEDPSELLSDRPLRRPTEGGIEAHITAHAAGVPEITAITCAVFGPLRESSGGRVTASPPTDRSTTVNTPLAVGASADAEEEAPLTPKADSLCGELRQAFACPPTVPSCAVGRLKAKQQQNPSATGLAEGHPGEAPRVPPGSHLVDGLYGAAGEFDAFDPSLLPPVITNRTASAAVSFTLPEEPEKTSRKAASQRGDAQKKAAARALRIRPGLSGGFPVSLPTYADDRKQHWRLAARAVEAFGPPECVCTPACCAGSLPGPEASADTVSLAAATSAAPAETEALSTPVHPLGALKRPPDDDEGPPGTRLGPFAALAGCLGALRGAQHLPASAAVRAALSSSSSDAGPLPKPLIEAVGETALAALRVQQHALLPLLPVPPEPAAARKIHDAAVKELSGVFEDPASASREGEAASQLDLCVCTALSLCPAWLLCSILRAKADGVAVHSLLLELSGELEMQAERKADTGDGAFGEASATTAADRDLQRAASLALKSATYKMAGASVEGDLGVGQRAVRHDWGTSVVGAADMWPLRKASDAATDSSCAPASLWCQLFLVSASVLCWLRLAVPVPGGSSWRLVAAAEAAARFCLRVRPVLSDAVASRWVVHGKTEETHCLSGETTCQRSQRAPSQEHITATTVRDASAEAHMYDKGSERSKAHEGHLPFIHDVQRPAMIPRAIWATWGPPGSSKLHPPAADKEIYLALSEAETATERQGALLPRGPSDLPTGEFLESLWDAREGDNTAGERHAEIARGFLSTMLTWLSTPQTPSGSSLMSPLGSTAPAEDPLRPLHLSRDLLPACAWLRLDGRLHASLVQLLSLRLWCLLLQRPGSTAQQLQGMLCLLDDCEVQFLLHCLAEEGIVTASTLWRPSHAVQASLKGVSRIAPRTSLGSGETDSLRDHDVCQGLDEASFAVHRNGVTVYSIEATNEHQEDPNPGLRAPEFDGGTPIESSDTWGHPISGKAALPAVSVAEYAFEVQTIYLPNAAADVLPKYALQIPLISLILQYFFMSESKSQVTAWAMMHSTQYYLPAGRRLQRSLTGQRFALTPTTFMGRQKLSAPAFRYTYTLRHSGNESCIRFINCYPPSKTQNTSSTENMLAGTGHLSYLRTHVVESGNTGLGTRPSSLFGEALLSPSVKLTLWYLSGSFESFGSLFRIILLHSILLFVIMMHNTDQTVAGLPSARLSQLASPQLMKKFRRDTILGSKHSALRDEMSAILQPNVPDICSRRGNRETETLQGYAGKYTNKINDSTYCHGSKKQSSETNKSDQVATLFASVGSKAEVPHSGLRSLRQYFSPDQLNEAFCTKFHVTDALTGRTEIMTARRPGKASAEVKFTAFDPYVASRARKSSVEKAKDNIEHDILGLMPKENQGVKDFLGTTIRHHRAAALECSETRVASSFVL
ncbi:hypothetical protein cyc_00686 [Cyclospora cayetanensis]|uniref:C2H2-type domain-containing protein n=1 Tax=Cyclospora cayetanensis TaxID=88456 RepID=A0A1D3CR99_9EIME|nr:hypothetical protein cyc_00686 [Cyclospora cayetanensis]